MTGPFIPKGDTVRNNSYLEMKAKELLGRQSYDSFDAYVAVYPKAEHFRRWLTDPRHMGLIIFPCMPYWCGLPGEYFWAYYGKDYVRNADNKYEWCGLYYVHVNDSDDGGANKNGLTLEQAVRELENLKMMAPFAIPELEAFGYSYY